MVTITHTIINIVIIPMTIMTTATTIRVLKSFLAVRLLPS